MARRDSGYGSRYGSETEKIERTEEEVATPREEVPVDPNPEKTKALADLDNYYAKVSSDLDREEREAHAVHDATEKKCEQIAASRVQITAEYEERKAAIEAEYPPPETPLAASRWGAPKNALPKGEPKADPALTS